MKVLKWIGVSIGCLVVIAGMTAYWLLEAGCSSTEFARFPSPTGNQDAVVFQIDCGATSGFNSQVTIVSSGDKKPSKRETILIVDDDHGQVADSNTYSNGGPKIRVSWISKNDINVSFPKKSRIFKRLENIGDLKIMYTVYE